MVEAMIGNHTVCHILVDNDSSVDILYADYLDKMGIPRARLQNNTQPLYGFIGDCIIPEGMIELLMTIGDRPHILIVMSRFLVVKGGDQYNAVIGRPTLRALKAVTLIYHQMMKFLTPSGIERVRENQYESRLTYSETVRHYAKLGQARRKMRMVMTKTEEVDLDSRLSDEETGTRPVEELIKVLIYEKEPTRKLKVGSELEEHSQEGLIAFLRSNPNVFA
ncbi:uncharacterized protein LOC112094245 [Morus notabilis]|uniref:uncharacterized protein LOC112094245 n=1 Tax=Morus notabilis TaxID=981085 RepID=UPI000CECFD64|nr:uncharacterized protein LOC112094245 [Morus notabilis]